MLRKTRKVFDMMSRYGTIGHIRWGKPAIDDRTQEQTDQDEDSAAESGIPLESIDFFIWYRSRWVSSNGIA